MILYTDKIVAADVSDMSHHGEDVGLDLTGKMTIYSFDPGARDLVTYLSHREHGTQVTWNYSNKEYKHRTGVL